MIAKAVLVYFEEKDAANLEVRCSVLRFLI